jgi:hypothetical protein
MNPAATLRARPQAALALLFGCWSAALATAPTLAMKAVLLAPAVLLPLAGWTLAAPGRWVALFLVSALLLPPLPIAIGDSGPHPCLLFAALGVWSGALWLGRWRMRVGGVGGALITLLSLMMASLGPAAVNSGVEIAAASLARVGLFGICVFLFFFTAGMPERGLPQIRALYVCAVAAALFACVDFYFQFPAPAGYGPQFVWLESGVFRRAQGLFYEASTLGNFCMFFLVMIAVAWTRPRAHSPVSRKWLAMGGAVLFAALVLSYSRASAVGFAVAMAVLLWWHREQIRVGRTVAVSAMALCIAALLVWQLFPQFAEMYWRRLSYSTELLTDGTESVLSGRVATWRTLAAWVEANPMQALIGIGYKTLPYTEHLGSPLVADNMYLSLLVETGIAGLAALVWLNWAILRAAARAARSADAQRAFCGLWMLCFWWGESVQMASGDLLTYWRVLPVYFFVLALAVRE